MTRTSGKTAVAMTKLGLTNVKASIQSDGLKGVLDQLFESVGRDEIAFKNMFSSVEAGGAAMLLVGATSQAYTDTLADMESGILDVNEAFLKQSQTAAANFQTLTNSMDAMKIAIGDVLLPFVIIAVNHITETLNQIPALFQLISLRVSQVINAITGTFKAFIAAIKGAFTAFKVGIIELWNSMLDALVAAVMAPIDAIRSAFGGLFDWITARLDGLIAFAASAVEKVKSFVGLSRKSKGPTDSSTRGRASGGIIQEAFTRVGEHGAEIIQAPRGSRVLTASESRAAMGGGGVNVTVNIRGDLIGLSKDEIVHTLGDQIMRMLKPHLDQA